MTREYILQNLEGACPIWFNDNPQLRDEVITTLQDSLLIPKPKFKVGDVVKPQEYHAQHIRMVHYSYGSQSWFYLLSDIDIVWFPESELELVEEGK